MSNNFRDIVPDPDHPKRVGLAERDAYMHGDMVLARVGGRDHVGFWKDILNKPFVGITCSGEAIPDLYHIANEGAPTGAMVAAAEALLNLCTAEERDLLCFDVNAPQWRVWGNPEPYVHRYGLRLEEQRTEVRSAIMEVLRASLSAKGYEKARGCMLINAFLGEIVDARGIMNEWSYNFLLFGRPSKTKPWGFNFYGHHLVLNVFIMGGQMVISPTFMGAEPNVIDTGPHKGLSLFDDEEQSGLNLMRSLDPQVQAQAWIYKLMKDPSMPPGRFHPADQRHLGGVYSDNRIIPYEGVSVTKFTAKQRRDLLDSAKHFISYLPDGPLQAKMEALERHLDDTYFSWIGGFGDEDPFYYKIHSPVIMIEFDHHSGVFLINEEPAKCHIHTLVRTPNGNDYGKDLLRQHYAEGHPGRRPGGV